jgi:uncharacterized protein YciI
MKFVHQVTYTSDNDKILANRPKHREYLAQLLDQGSIIASGPYADDSGAVFIFEAESREAAAALVSNDPFSRSGVFQKSELKPWKLVFANPALLKSDA